MTKTILKRTFFGVLCAVVLTAPAFVGCGDSNPGKGPDGGKDSTDIVTPPPPVRELDPALLLPNGFAWVGYVSGEYDNLGEFGDIFAQLGEADMGFVFKSDSTLSLQVNTMPGVWFPAFTGRWYTTANGTLTAYALVANPLIGAGTVQLPELIEAEYTVIGDALTVTLNGVPAAFTKTDITKGPDIDEEYEHDPALTNTAWVSGDGAVTWVFVYLKIGMTITTAIRTETETDESGDISVIQNEYFWYTKDGKLYLNMDEVTILDYSVNGDELTLDGETFKLTEPDGDIDIGFSTGF